MQSLPALYKQQFSRRSPRLAEVVRLREEKERVRAKYAPLAVASPSPEGSVEGPIRVRPEHVELFRELFGSLYTFEGDATVVLSSKTEEVIERAKACWGKVLNDAFSTFDKIPEPSGVDIVVPLPTTVPTGKDRPAKSKIYAPPRGPNRKAFSLPQPTRYSDNTDLSTSQRDVLRSLEDTAVESVAYFNELSSFFSGEMERLGFSEGWMATFDGLLDAITSIEQEGDGYVMYNEAKLMGTTMMLDKLCTLMQEARFEKDGVVLRPDLDDPVAIAELVYVSRFLALTANDDAMEAAEKYLERIERMAPGLAPEDLAGSFYLNAFERTEIALKAGEIDERKAKRGLLTCACIVELGLRLLGVEGERPFGAGESTATPEEEMADEIERALGGLGHLLNASADRIISLSGRAMQGARRTVRYVAGNPLQATVKVLWGMSFAVGAVHRTRGGILSRWTGRKGFVESQAAVVEADILRRAPDAVNAEGMISKTILQDRGILVEEAAMEAEMQRDYAELKRIEDRAVRYISELRDAPLWSAAEYSKRVTEAKTFVDAEARDVIDAMADDPAFLRLEQLFQEAFEEAKASGTSLTVAHDTGAIDVDVRQHLRKSIFGYYSRAIPNETPTWTEKKVAVYSATKAFVIDSLHAQGMGELVDDEARVEEITNRLKDAVDKFIHSSVLARDPKAFDDYTLDVEERPGGKSNPIFSKLAGVVGRLEEMEAKLRIEVVRGFREGKTWTPDEVANVKQLLKDADAAMKRIQKYSDKVLRTYLTREYFGAPVNATGRGGRLIDPFDYNNRLNHTPPEFRDMSWNYGRTWTRSELYKESDFVLSLVESELISGSQAYYLEAFTGLFNPNRPFLTLFFGLGSYAMTGAGTTLVATLGATLGIAALITGCIAAGVTAFPTRAASERAVELAKHVIVRPAYAVAALGVPLLASAVSNMLEHWNHATGIALEDAEFAAKAAFEEAARARGEHAASWIGGGVPTLDASLAANISVSDLSDAMRGAMNEALDTGKFTVSVPILPIVALGGIYVLWQWPNIIKKPLALAASGIGTIAGFAWTILEKLFGWCRNLLTLRAQGEVVDNAQMRVRVAGRISVFSLVAMVLSNWYTRRFVVDPNAGITLGDAYAKAKESGTPLDEIIRRFGLKVPENRGERRAQERVYDKIVKDIFQDEPADIHQVRKRIRATGHPLLNQCLEAHDNAVAAAERLGMDTKRIHRMLLDDVTWFRRDRLDWEKQKRDGYSVEVWDVVTGRKEQTYTLEDVTEGGLVHVGVAWVAGNQVGPYNPPQPNAIDLPRP